jgi:oligopeptide transport system permease protein
MASYLVRRVLWIIPVLFVVSLITFVLMRLTPGGPWAVTDRSVSPAQIAAFKEKYGFDLPWHEQYINWVTDFLRGDLGPSYRYIDRGVNAIIADGIGTTIQLGVMAFVVAVAIGIPLGVIAALGHNRLPDYLSTGISVMGIATPSFVLAIVLVLVFSLGLNWFPATSSRWGDWHAWVLPVIALAGYPIAQIARYTRASMLEVTRKDFIRTAHSKGIRERAVVVRHMIRNALIPVLTILGPVLAFLVTGSFVIEYFFGVPGIGRFYVQAIGTRDYSLLMAMTMLYAFVVAAMNVLVDVLYAYVDPRIRYS